MKIKLTCENTDMYTEYKLEYQLNSGLNEFKKMRLTESEFIKILSEKNKIKVPNDIKMLLEY